MNGVVRAGAPDTARVRKKFWWYRGAIRPRGEVAFFISFYWRETGECRMNRVFTADPGVNAWGVVGLIIMAVGAILNFVVSRRCLKYALAIRVIGLLLTLVGAVLVVAIGK